jgi:protein-arginine kinase
MELKHYLILTKPVKGIYGSYLSIEGDDNGIVLSTFINLCENLKKEDSRICKKNENTYEFMTIDNELIYDSAIHVSKELKIPLVIMP